MKLPFFGSSEPKGNTVPPPVVVPDGATVVLMVDDEPAQRQLFAFALRREGYCVLEACNGAEAIDMASQAGHLDLVVSDVMMPVMRGPELATRLRERYPHVPVLFVSGYLMNEELGPDAHTMQKPFVRKDLLKSVFDIVGPPRPVPVV